MREHAKLICGIYKQTLTDYYCLKRFMVVYFLFNLRFIRSFVLCSLFVFFSIFKSSYPYWSIQINDWTLGKVCECQVKPLSWYICLSIRCLEWNNARTNMMISLTDVLCNHNMCKKICNACRLPKRTKIKYLEETGNVRCLFFYYQRLCIALRSNTLCHFWKWSTKRYMKQWPMAGKQ